MLIAGKVVPLGGIIVLLHTWCTHAYVHEYKKLNTTIYYDDVWGARHCVSCHSMNVYILITALYIIYLVLKTA